VLPPFSEKFCVDFKQTLNKEKFKETIYDFFKEKNLTALSQITATSAFLTPHVLAQFASKAYTDCKAGETDVQYETRLVLPDGLKILTKASNSKRKNGYFGASCWHLEHQQVVMGHRGTKRTNLVAYFTDVVGVFFKHQVPKMDSDTTLSYKVVELLREINQENRINFRVVFTSH